MKTIEEYVHERLEELHAKQKGLRKELANIDVRVEELSYVISKIANEPIPVSDGSDNFSSNSYAAEPAATPTKSESLDTSLTDELAEVEDTDYGATEDSFAKPEPEPTAEPEPEPV